MKVFCVIPAYNEAKNLLKIVEQVKLLVDRAVVVDDGSTDDTTSLTGSDNLVLLRHIINRGQGAALRTGTEYSLNHGADIIVHFDADGQFLTQDIVKIVAPIKSDEAEVVFGSRFLLKEHKQGMPATKRYLLMPLARLVNKLLFRVNLTDPQSGFRAMTAQAAKKISWRQDRMAHCSEIMFQVKKNNFQVAEVPIKVIYSNFGQNFWGGLKIVRDLFLAKFIS